MEINMTLTMAVMYVPVMIVLCSNILNQKYYCKTSCKKMNLKKASEFIYFYHPVLISIIGKFIYASFALFGMVSILMIFINWLLQRCDSKVYRMITRWQIISACIISKKRKICSEKTSRQRCERWRDSWKVEITPLPCGQTDIQQFTRHILECHI